MAMDLANESGEKCAHQSCTLYEYLPFRCDRCSMQFCSEHFQPDRHDCPHARASDVIVPICPRCGMTIAFKRGDDIDRKLSEHIDSGCISNVQNVPVKKTASSGRCPVRGCKDGMQIPALCKSCGGQFCLKHRLEADHVCSAHLRQPVDLGSTSTQDRPVERYTLPRPAGSTRDRVDRLTTTAAWLPGALWRLLCTAVHFVAHFFTSLMPEIPPLHNDNEGPHEHQQ